MSVGAMDASRAGEALLAADGCRQRPNVFASIGRIALLSMSSVQNAFEEAMLCCVGAAFLAECVVKPTAREYQPSKLVSNVGCVPSELSIGGGGGARHQRRRVRLHYHGSSWKGQQTWWRQGKRGGKRRRG